MELRHLRYFVTIAEEQSFRRAAVRLHVSQSPLSRQMQDLAAEMGVKLFEPAGRGIKLTAAGRLFAERARAILASVDAAVDEAKGVAEGRLGTVVIGFETGSTFMGALSSLIAAFRRRTPRVGLQLIPMSSVEQWAALRQGTITFGYGAYAPNDDALSHLEMSRDRLGLLVSREHRLSRLGKIRLRDLEDERVLMQPRQLFPRLHADIITAARARGASLHVTAEIVDLEALLALVVIGDAVTFVAEKFAENLPPAAVWRPIDDLHIHLSEFVTWRAEDDAAPVVRALIDSAREVGPRLQRATQRTRSAAATQRRRPVKR
jgi:DNA-binding transcriptional LysR family regulator